MSIINQTLRDLDARAPATEAGAGGSTPITVPAPRASRRKAGIVLGLLLVIAGFALWLAFAPVEPAERDRTVRASGSPAVPEAVPVPEAARPPDAAPALPIDAARTPVVEALDATPAAVARVNGSEESRHAPAPAVDALTVSPSPPPATEAPRVAERDASLKFDTHIIRPRETKGASIAKAVTKPTPDEEAEDRYRKALNLVNKGRDNQARPLLEEALKLAPGHVAARQVLATQLNESGMNREAEAILREGRRVNPDIPWFALSLARLLAARGELDAAAESLRGGLDGRGVTADYHASYAAILSRLKRPVEAASQYEQALALQPGQGTWWMGLGLALSAQGKLPEARAAYGRALQTGNLPEKLEDFVRAKLSE